MPTSFCPKCGQPLQQGNSFCPNCGNRLAGVDGMTNGPMNGNSNKTIIIVLLSVIIGLLVAGGVVWALLSFETESSSTEAVVDSTATLQIDTTSSADASPAISDSQNSVEQPVSKYPPLVVVAGDNVCLRTQPNESTKLEGSAYPHLNTGDEVDCVGATANYYKIVYNGRNYYLPKKYGRPRE